MFEALQKASVAHKYQVTWVELAPVQFQGVIPAWFTALSKSSLTGGPSSSQREALINEFYWLLHVQKQVLEAGSAPGSPSMGVERAKVNIGWFATEHKKKFGSSLKPPAEERTLNELVARQHLLSGKLQLLDEKLQLVNYWMRGVQDFPDHRHDASLMFQYMGNAPSAKVRLFLDVLCTDGDKVAKIRDDRVFKASFETQRGLTTSGENGKLHKVEWTNDRFKRAIKAEIGASYGVGVSGKCELEFKGIKAQLSADAWAGARAKAEGAASWTKGRGGSVTGTVSAEIGVKLSAQASIDCADIFLCEASVEGFAGAMVRGDLEITATVNGVKAKITAEAFLGAKLTGTAKMTLKLQGYELIGAEATASLTAGIGAKFALEFECSAFGGTTFGIESGVTYGVGTETAVALTVNANNFAPALYSLFFTGYLSLLGQDKEKHAYVNYFRNLEDNERLFLKGREIIETQMRDVIMERNSLFSQYAGWRQLEGLASFRATGTV